MKKYKLILIALHLYFMVGCVEHGGKYSSNTIDEKVIDTIYFTNPSLDVHYVKPIIKLRSDSSGLSPLFLKIDTMNFVKILISNYKNYPVYILDPINLIVEKSNSERGEFLLYPTDSVCQFDIYLDFGKGNAVMKFVKSGSLEYQYKPVEGPYIMGRIIESVHQ
jgi:hypothetical protein